VAIAIAMLACVGLVGGCSRAISGTPAPMPAASATEVAGMRATDGPAGLRPGTTDATLPVDNTDHGDVDRLAVDAVSDLDEYWRQAFPQSFGGRPFPDLRRLVSYDSGARGIPLCNASSAGQVTAFYCPADDSLDWDRARFLPMLSRGFGSMAAVAALAHAMGHAVEQRAATVPPGAPAIVAEQQADCFTGAFLRSVADSRSSHFQLSTGNGLSQVMGGLSFVRDAAPGNSPGDDAHGSALDRITAFEQGFTNGSPKSCAEMDANTVEQRTGQSHFWTAAPAEAPPVTAGNLDVVESSLQDVFRSTAAPVPKITTSPGGCASVRPTVPASYCPDTNTLSLDVLQLQKVAAQEREGSFAAYADVASRYALSVENAAGLSIGDQNASLRTGCLVGAWSGVLVDQPLGGRNRASGPRIAPDDIDAMVAELLGPRGLVAANVAGASVPAGFARVDAFRTGFGQGITGCAAFG
jgi:predicted metalloprotease